MKKYYLILLIILPVIVKAIPVKKLSFLTYGFLSAFLVIKFQNLSYEKAFTDILWMSFIIIGLIISLTFDDKDTKIMQNISVRYIVFSVAVSIGVSMVVAIAKSENKIDLFWFYALTILSSTFSPFIARRIIKSLPITIDKGLNNIAKSRLESFENKNKENSDDTDR